MLDYARRLLYGRCVGITNPIKRVRREQRKTLEEFSEDVGCHLQALYLNERGCYSKILPRIMGHLLSLGNDYGELASQYVQYVHETRQAAGKFYRLHKFVPFNLGEPVTNEGHPFVIFRESCLAEEPVSRMMFAKNFCVHPAQLYTLENSRTPHLPEQVLTALQVAGLPDIVVQELNNRIEEYVSGGYAYSDAV